MRRIRALLLAVLAVLLAAPAGVQLAPGTAAAASPAGWKLAFSDDFTSGTVKSPWGKYGSAYSIGTSYFRPDDVTVGGGMLKLRIEKREYGGKPFTSGGLGLNLPMLYGRYEFQAKAPVGTGIDAYMTLWPATGDSDSVATLIEILAKPGNQNAYLTNGYGADKQYLTVPGNYSDAMHSYVVEWTPAYLSISKDGKQLLRSSHVPTVRRTLGFAVSNGDNLTGTPNAATVLPADFLVSHVRVYSYAPGTGAGAGSGAKKATPTASRAAKASPSASPSPSPSNSPSAAATTAAPALVADLPTARAVSDSSSTTPLLTVLIVVLLLAAGTGTGVWVLRNRRGHHRP